MGEEEGKEKQVIDLNKVEKPKMKLRRYKLTHVECALLECAFEKLARSNDLNVRAIFGNGAVDSLWKKFQMTDYFFVMYTTEKKKRR